MTITQIRQQKNGRFAIYIDGEYALSVDSRTLNDSCLSKGGVITLPQLNELRETAEFRTANDRAMTILSYRDHSKEELRRKLSRTVGEEQAEKAAEHMEELGLIDDAEYAAKLARELLETRLMGDSRALYEMTKRGIDRETAENAIDEANSDPGERISRFLSKKYPGWDDDEKVRRRALAALSRNGFKWEDVRRVIDEY
ncbi:MAG TPA: RecX family transcriptional regulator [Ruminiclostridium sp.]|nr:RecX family transcriptional regulator [Ruminiclostridium sp.]